LWHEVEETKLLDTLDLLLANFFYSSKAWK
jgi:hypothetical protein